MLNKITEGKTLILTAPEAGYTSGQGVLAGATFGVINKTAASGEQTVLVLEGEYTIVKATGAGTDAVIGARAYWDDTAKKITPVETDNTEIGVFGEAVTTAAATARVLLGVRTVLGAVTP